jgi:hypothetical protein|tara:strand:- start:5580 stop:6896 length:1317 start_codon:yes stop_codon:yes gene_type:complete
MSYSLPYISTYDPATTSGGSLDPLGVYLIADRLATKLVPGVRERMSQPRYLTAMVVGAHICSPFRDEYAVDGFTPAYQVYEWHIVEGLISMFMRNDPSQIQGLPGIQKGKEAFQNNLPLRPDRYLKTPNVFGFHGVYRTLSTELKVVSDDYLIQETGHELLQTWQKEQKLMGVYTGNGSWNRMVSLFREAIIGGLSKGEVARAWAWNVHEEFATYLRPNAVGRREAKLIYAAMRSENRPLRSEIVNFLLSEAGQNAWKNERSERIYMAKLKDEANTELSQLIDVINAYERFARYFQDAFNCCLHQMSASGKATYSELADLEGVIKACNEIPFLFSDIEQGLSQHNMQHDFLRLFSEFQQKMTPSEWVMRMWQHHCKIQKSKGRFGKSNWFERYDDGSFRINPSNTIGKPIELSNEYVHGYRTQPLWSFLVNLKKVKDG